MQTTIEESTTVLTDTQRSSLAVATFDVTGSNDTTGTSSKHNETKPPSSSLSLNKPDINQFQKIDDSVFQCILSFVGKHQYRFIGSVNRHFRKSYLSLYPHKTTHLSASTMELTIYCLEDIGANRTFTSEETKQLQGQSFYTTLRPLIGGFWPYGPQKTEQLRLLWHSAARFGNIDAILYMWRLWEPCRPEIQWRYDLYYKAAEYGQMDLLQWALRRNFYIKDRDERVCQYAIGSGNLEVFYWAKEAGFCWDMDGTSHHQAAAHIAAEKGQLEILQWLHELGCELTCYRFCDDAAKSGQLEVLQWLHSIGCNWKNSTFYWAVRGNHVDVVKYMIDNGFNKVEWAVDVAAQLGCMTTLQLFHSINYGFDENLINNAAYGGNLNIIIWALNHGFDLTKRTCYYAAVGGQLDTLKWLRAQGCPWNFLTTHFAKNEEIYSYAKCNGCPIAEGNPRTRITHLELKSWEHIRLHR